jgi:hypothetical protein
MSPSVILANLPCSGSSAIDPILRELLSLKGFNVTPYGPEGTQRLRRDLEQGLVKSPFYHWTHDPIETFEGMLGNKDFRFIFLHRDLRDVAVSWAYDTKHSVAQYKEASIDETLEVVVTHILPLFAKAATKWIKANCMVITFAQIKDDMPQLVQSVLRYIEYFKQDEVPTKSCSREFDLSDEIKAVVTKHSFEARAGRKRGEDGVLIRDGYMLRKGASGEWKTHFSPELTKRFNAELGRELVALGYESEQWGWQVSLDAKIEAIARQLAALAESSQHAETTNAEKQQRLEIHGATAQEANGFPVLVDYYRDYNLVRRENPISRAADFVAVRQSFGDVKLFEETLGQRQIEPDILTGRSLDELRSKIDIVVKPRHSVPEFGALWRRLWRK